MLKTVNLFSELLPEQLAELEKVSTVRKTPKNTILFMEGDKSGQLFVIRSGQVCVYTDDEDGKQLVLNFMGPDEYFGELSLLDSRPRSASVSTTQDCEFICISRDAFRDFLGAYPELNQRLMMALVERIRRLTGSMRDMALMDVYGRVAHTLERLCSGDNTQPKLTHQDIANMVGASREMVSRVMKELVFGGYIRVEQKYITLLKPFPRHW